MVTTTTGKSILGSWSTPSAAVGEQANDQQRRHHHGGEHRVVDADAGKNACRLPGCDAHAGAGDRALMTGRANDGVTFEEACCDRQSAHHHRLAREHDWLLHDRVVGEFEHVTIASIARV
mgnify:CR=1 FL=1